MPVRGAQQQSTGRGVQHDHAHLRVALPQLLQQRGHEPARGRADDAEAHGADDDVAQVRQVGVEGVELALDPTGPLQHGQSLVGGLGRGTVDQGDAEFVLETTDVCGDVRLHGSQRLRGTREGSVFC